MEKFIMADGCAVRVSDTGRPRRKPSLPHAGETENLNDGDKADALGHKTIVLLHGYLEAIESWDELAPLLKPYLRVVAIDLPGHGISQVRGDVHSMEFLADTVHAAMEELGIDRYVICGHSMGGYVALELLRKYPERVEEIIMLHSTPFADTPEKQANRDREIEIVLSGKKELLAINSQTAFAPQNRRRFTAAIEESADLISLTDDAGIVAILRGMRARRDNNAMLASSPVPQMFIFGRNDEYIPVAVAQEVIQLHPRAEIVWLENSGHMGHVEEPQETAGAILSFFLRTAGA